MFVLNQMYWFQPSNYNNYTPIQMYGASNNLSTGAGIIATAFKLICQNCDCQLAPGLLDIVVVVVVVK